jgi:hypothetical protein
MPALPLPSPEQRLIRTFTGRAEQPIRTVFLTAVQAAQLAIVLSDLLYVIERGGGDADLRAVIQIDTMLGKLDVDLTPLLESTLFRATAAAEPVFAESMGFEPLDLGIFRRDAIVAARTQVGTLIQGIDFGRLNPLTGARSRGQLEVVRDLIAQGYETGRPYQQTATLVKDVIGLDDRRATALARYQSELEAQGYSGKELAGLVAKERRRKLKSRALAISKTESVRAGAIAQDTIWEEAVNAGQLDPAVWEQEFLAEPRSFDPKVCPSRICPQLHLKRAPIGGEFLPGIFGEPLHPWCGCSRRLRRKR